MSNSKQILLFDGVCNFCSFWVDFIIRRDKRDVFRFAALQSEIAKELTGKLIIDSSETDSFILISNNKYFTKSTAALMVLKELRSAYKILYPLILLPEFFRDYFYDLIARNRYKIFGKRNECRIPTEEEKKKFLI